MRHGRNCLNASHGVNNYWRSIRTRWRGKKFPVMEILLGPLPFMDADGGGGREQLENANTFLINDDKTYQY